MLSGGVRILDLDGSVTRQAGLRASGRPVSIVDLRDLGPSARLWASRSQAARLRASLDPAQAADVTFLGSGDYHFVSALLLAQFEGPLAVVVFDHHPDWDLLPPRHGCGAWVSRALELRSVARIVLVGNASDDLVFPSILTGNRRALREGRIAALPWESPRQKSALLNPPLPWQPLAPDPLAVLSRALDALPTRRVYLSIDKDCLTADSALTNWEPGRLTLDLLLRAVTLVRGRCELVGADITGEYSEPRLRGPWKRLCSRIDHPSDFSAKGHADDEIDRVNESTNRRLLEALLD